LEELDLVLFVQGDDGLLPVGQAAYAELVTPLLAQAHLRPDLADTNIEQLLDGRLDLLLRRPLVHLERVGVMPGELVRALFRDQRPQEDLVCLQLRTAVGLGPRSSCHRMAPSPWP